MAIEKIDFVLEDENGENHQYEVNQIPAMKSLKLLQKLAKAMGKAESGFSETKDAGAMGLAIVGAIGDDAVYEVVEELFKYKVLRDGVKLNPDDVFTGNMSEMFLLIVELAKINWESMFKGKLGGMLEKFKKLA